MSTLSGRLLFWSPRALSIAFAAFLSLFALDVFSEHRGFRDTALALTMHLVPVFVVLAILLLAWRWEWVGALFYAFAGLLYVALVTSRSRPGSYPVDLDSCYRRTGVCDRAVVYGDWLKHASCAPLPTKPRPDF